MIQEILTKPFEVINPIGFNKFTKEINKDNYNVDFNNVEHVKHIFEDMVINPIKRNCNLIKVEFSFNYYKKEFTTILQVNLFYMDILPNMDSDILCDTYCNQQEFATKCLQSFFDIMVFAFFGNSADEYIKNCQSKNPDSKRYNTMFKLSDENYNTAIFFGGDNFDGFTITDTEE